MHRLVVRRVNRAAARALLGVLMAAVTIEPALAQNLFGPGKFEIVQSDDRFSTDGMTTLIGKHNRVTNKTNRGNPIIDDRGLYLDPMVIKHKTDGAISSVGFVLHYETNISSGIGDANTLGLPQRVAFLLADGALISADVEHADRRVGVAGNYDRYTKTVEAPVTETGTITLSVADMARVAHASAVTIHVEGATRDWTIEARQVSKSFLLNLVPFYDQELSAQPK